MDVPQFLESNIKSVTGCTEPIAVGYATSLAYSALLGNIKSSGDAFSFNGEASEPDDHSLERITIKTDRDVFKNAIAVLIPGTHGQRGMSIASAMGLYCNPEKGLGIFNGVTEDVVAKANKILKSEKVIVEKVTDDADKANIDIQVNLLYRINGDTSFGHVRIKGAHDNVTLIQVDRNTIYEDSNSRPSIREEVFPKTLEEMLEIVQNMNPESKGSVYDGMTMNLEMAENGMRTDYGLRVGRALQSLVDQGVISYDLVTEVRIKAAAAGDARMGGANMPVTTSAGSGNQGITALVPILVVGQRNRVNKGKISEAGMLSHLVTKYVSNHSGYLSAICGCAIKAGIGAAAGLAYLLGGDTKHINNAINIMAANITGMICDGAKEGCALKLSTAAGTATESALMAISGMEVPPSNGIINQKAEITIQNIGKIAKAMAPTDIEIVEIMQNK